MAQNDLLKRYLDAGVAFTAMTQARAQDIVNDLVKTGEVQTGQAQAAVLDLMERGRRNTENLFQQVRNEVQDQVKNLGLATQSDIARLERKISDLKAPSGTAKRSSAKKTSAKKATTKSAAKKTPAKRAAARKRA